MAKKMLIDATHPEETRVVVADGNKVEEFDFESLNRRQLAGNIYLAKVTRVEPSLQAAFIEYGGNRHGFLAFSEIHPDYYQIPKADRDAILAEERAYAEAQADADEEAATSAATARPDADEDGEAEDPEAIALDDAPKGRKSRSRSRSRSRRKGGEGGSDEGVAQDGDDAPDDAETVIAREGVDAVVSGEAADVSEAAEAADDEEDGGRARTIDESTGLEDATVTAEAGAAEPAGMETVDLGDPADDDPVEAPGSGRRRGRRSMDASDRDDGVETVGGDDARDYDRAPRVQRPKARKYKIQEVVKVRQIMLVQVVKEERGNKGAALTTYLSLAGRYCVLMPNTARGGGISRKITNAADRKKLKEIAQEIDVPQGAGLIVRTAGAKRTKTEIKRDYEYLQRQWEQVRELTLRSIAPAAIYEEGNLIHRSIRDYYSAEIDEVIVEGEAGFREARDYMRLIVPSAARDVKLHEGPQPLFAKHGVESYLASMFSPTVQLKSGGYIVIGITEALVAIDVNSGKSTREGSVEDTATKTNLEAADEVARQMRLRDLAGLIVIDFIDMDERRNNAAVEKRMKDALKGDRARIQMGRISGFGLMELSRQRLRPGMLEATTQACPHCHGTGLIRSDDSVALQILRALEEEGGRGRSREVLVRAPVNVSNYLMNEKREHLAGIEARYDMAVRMMADPSLVAPDHAIEKFKTATRTIPKPSSAVQTDTSWTSEEDDLIEAEAEEADVAEEDSDDEAQAAADPAEAEQDGERPADGEGGRRKRRRRSRRRKGGGEDGAEASGEASDETEAPDIVADAGMTLVDDSGDAAPVAEQPAPADTEDAPKSRSRSRSRTRSRKAEPADAQAAEVPEAEVTPEAPAEEAASAPAPEAAEAAPKAPRSRSRAKAPAPAQPEAGPSEAVTEAAAAAEASVAAADEPVQEPVQEPAPLAVPEPSAEVMTAPAPEPAEAAGKPKRRGWWSFGS